MLAAVGKVAQRQVDAAAQPGVSVTVDSFEAVPARGEVRLRVDGRVAGPAFVEELTRIISSFPGEASVVMEVATDEGERVLRLGPAYKVSPKADFFSEVRVLGGEAQLV